MEYLEVIKIACMFFPVIALVITIPYFLWQYHKIGAVPIVKTICFYSFALYLLCVYYLVILPLPSIEKVKHLTTPYAQLIPFNFIVDIIKESGFVINKLNTWLPALSSQVVLQVVFNFVMLIPLGMYLRYLFKLKLKDTIIISFVTTLFFELTQLSGLYGVYPRSYRLFDVDDLMLNFAGSMFGYMLVSLFKFVPKMEDIEYNAYKKIKNVTIFRKVNSYIVDFTILFFFQGIISIICYKFSWYNKHLILMLFITAILYFVISIKISDGYTIGKKFVGIKVVSDLNNKLNENNKIKIWQIVVRVLSIGFFYCIAPFFLAIIIGMISIAFMYIVNDIFKIDVNFKLLNTHISFDFLLCAAVFCILEGIYFYLIFHGVKNKKRKGKDLIYERLSKTYEISTLKLKKDNITIVEPDDKINEKNNMDEEDSSYNRIKSDIDKNT